jgi:spore germination protein YaaH
MTKTNQSEAPQSDVSAISPVDLQTAVEAARTEAHATGVTVGKELATARIKAILTAPETEGREAQALVLALETEMTAADAAKVLAASPKAITSTSIADRAAQEAELGAETPADHRNRAERSAAGWTKAVTNANARFG